MKKNLVVSAAVLCGAAASLAGAAEPIAPPEREKVLMLYVSKSFGTGKRSAHAPFTLGLRLQQSSPIDFRRSLDVFDLRYSPGGRTTLSSSGALMYDSYAPESWNSWWPYGLMAAALVGVSCATENWPCEDDDDEGEPYTPPENESPGVG